VLAEFGWYGGGKPKFDGGRHPAASEEQQARWCRRVVETTAGLATGWLNWGFYDHREAKDVSELTGLLATDGKVKAWGREFQKLSARYSGQSIAPAERSPRPTLDWDRCLVSPAAGNAFREEYYRAWSKAFAPAAVKRAKLGAPRSPPPQPSPVGRGSAAASLANISRASARDGNPNQITLSRGERAGVRGKETFANPSASFPQQHRALTLAAVSSAEARGVHEKERNTVHRLRIEPREIDDLFPNPGMGWQTFHRFADGDQNLQGLPSASAYFRFYWREIEPKDGQIDFSRLDELLAHARRAGQKLAFRIMCTGSGEYMDVPAWLQEQGSKGIEFMYGGRKHWIPEFSDSLFQQKHFRLIRELGRRYDGHTDLDLVDIGSVGLWGEWHMSSTTAIDTGKPVPMPPVEIRQAIIDAWQQAFPETWIRPPRCRSSVSQWPVETPADGIR
jgi:hypothetical protein